MERERTTVATTEAMIASEDDPIKRMIWSLKPDNKARYPKRLKVVLDYLELQSWVTKIMKPYGKQPLSVKIVKGNPEGRR